MAKEIVVEIAKAGVPSPSFTPMNDVLVDEIQPGKNTTGKDVLNLLHQGKAVAQMQPASLSFAQLADESNKTISAVTGGGKHKIVIENPIKLSSRAWTDAQWNAAESREQNATPRKSFFYERRKAKDFVGDVIISGLTAKNFVPVQ